MRKTKKSNVIPFRGKQVLRDGKWQPGSATPEQLPDHMRGLPGEWLTKHEADGDNIHELDPPHIVTALVEEKAQALNKAAQPEAPETKLKRTAAQPGQNVPLSQWEIDIVRFRVLRALIDMAVRAKAQGEKTDIFAIKHLRFPENNVNIYELHDGNPPRDAERNPHERNFSLELDITNWPKTIVDHLANQGVTLPDVKKMLDAAPGRIVRPS